jgi:ribosomal protein L37AE/L43A
MSEPDIAAKWFRDYSECSRCKSKESRYCNKEWVWYCRCGNIWAGGPNILQEAKTEAAIKKARGE